MPSENAGIFIFTGPGTSGIPFIQFRDNDVLYSIGIDTIGGESSFYWKNDSGSSDYKMRLDFNNGNLKIDGTYYGAGGVSAGSADIAEKYDASEPLEAGDVVVVDTNKNNTIRKSSKPYEITVVGVISTKPGITLGDMEASKGTSNSSVKDNRPALALAGSVPVKVTKENGAIKQGDLLTTSSKPGYAMKCEVKNIDLSSPENERWQIIADNEHCRNSILGKALESFDGETGKIMALVTLQ